MRHPLGWFGILFFWLVFAPQLLAHDPGLSVTTARLGADSLGIHLAMSPTDVALVEWAAAGLRVASTVRLARLDCLEQSLLFRWLGALTPADAQIVRAVWVSWDF